MTQKMTRRRPAGQNPITGDVWIHGAWISQHTWRVVTIRGIALRKRFIGLDFKFRPAKQPLFSLAA